MNAEPQTLAEATAAAQEVDLARAKRRERIATRVYARRLGDYEAFPDYEKIAAESVQAADELIKALEGMP